MRTMDVPSIGQGSLLKSSVPRRAAAFELVFAVMLIFPTDVRTASFPIEALTSRASRRIIEVPIACMSNVPNWSLYIVSRK